MDSMIRLFRGVIVETKKKKKPTKAILERTIRNGYLLSGEVLANYPLGLDSIMDRIEKLVGLSGKQMNSSFHKSWKKVKDASIEQLFIEQIIHYITTYGYESLGIYNENTVYIPEEALEVPALKKVGKVDLILIKGYTKDEVKQKLLDLLNTGIALKDETVKDVLDIVTYLEFGLDEVETIRNREVKIAMYDYMGLVPENPVELLRYLVFKATNKTLLIKDKATIETIKARNNIDILGILNRYAQANGLEKLAEIFYRFKPLFLAFRTSKQLKVTVNKIRKLAVKNHKPMPVDYLNSVTGMIKHRFLLTPDTRLKEELEKVNTFRKIRLAYALKYRTQDTDAILYKIRNGKGYATTFDFNDKDTARKVLKTVIKSIAKDIEPNVSDKRIYIPKNIAYTLPATEKQFTGMFPSGTCVTLPKDMIVGIYWENVNKNRIDLDLSLIGLGVKYGWDGYYRNGEKSILFSGDVTDAPKGATELYYVKRQHKASYTVNVNYFNYNAEIPVPFKILVAYENVKDFGRNYMVNPNNIVAVTGSTCTEKQKALGLLVVGTDSAKFYFSETNLGKSITASTKDWAEHARKYLLSYHENMININDVLIEAGAKFADSPDKCDIDLSPGKLEKDTFIKMLTKVTK